MYFSRELFFILQKNCINFNYFGSLQQQQPQQGPTSAQEALVAAVFNCCVFGDERDQVLAKWNLLQAQWGTGGRKCL